MWLELKDIQGHQLCSNWKSIYDFLLVIIVNLQLTPFLK